MQPQRASAGSMNKTHQLFGKSGFEGKQCRRSSNGLTFSADGTLICEHIPGTRFGMPLTGQTAAHERKEAAGRIRGRLVHGTHGAGYKSNFVSAKSQSLCPSAPLDPETARKVLCTSEIGPLFPVQSGLTQPLNICPRVIPYITHGLDAHKCIPHNVTTRDS